jgi:tripartite-type tricarboxylate transporter receptor subunit TctC
MTMNDMKRRLLCAAAALALCSAAGAQVGGPAIRMIVPIPPGGAPDVAARILGQKLSESLNKPVVIENKPGANGNIAADSVAKSTPDGQTLLLTMDSTLVINPHLFAKMPFNPEKDLIPIASVAQNQFVLTINPSLPVKDFKEFIDYARKANPPLNYASGGNGSQHHLTMEMLKARAGINLVHVPYKGGAPATMATVAGEVPVMFAGTSNAGQIKSGKLRAIAVTGSNRSSAFPDVPTIGETYPGFENKIWLGLFAPAGTPPDIVNRLREETNKILKTQYVKEKFASAGGLEPMITTPKEFQDLIHRDLAKYGKVVKDSGVRLD